MRKTIKDAAPYSSHPPWRSDGPLLPHRPTFPRAGGMASTTSKAHHFSPSSKGRDKWHRWDLAHPSTFPLQLPSAERMGERAGPWSRQGQHSQSPVLLAAKLEQLHVLQLIF